MRRIPLKTVLALAAKLAVAYITPGKIDDVALAASIIHHGISIAGRKKMITSTEESVKMALDSEDDVISTLDTNHN